MFTRPGTAVYSEPSPNPASGFGTFVSSTGSPVSMPAISTDSRTLATLTLDPGDWDVSGSVKFVIAGAEIFKAVQGITLVAAGFPEFNECASMPVPFITLLELSQSTPIVRVSVLSQTPVYLTFQCQYTGTSVIATGFIRARRFGSATA